MDSPSQFTYVFNGATKTKKNAKKTQKNVSLSVSICICLRLSASVRSNATSAVRAPLWRMGSAYAPQMLLLLLPLLLFAFVLQVSSSVQMFSNCLAASSQRALSDKKI